MSISALSPTSTTNALVQAYTVSIAFGAMVKGEFWRFVATTDCWIAQGATPTATIGNGSTFVPVGKEVTLAGSNGAQVAVLQNTTGGNACLCKLANY
jgi:hypothetical protein